MILSAMDLDDVIIRGFWEGADAYLHKPFNPDELVARIEAIRRSQQTTPRMSDGCKE
jgi:DNA-binding response OmpR family regulator